MLSRLLPNILYLRYPQYMLSRQLSNILYLRYPQYMLSRLLSNILYLRYPQYMLSRLPIVMEDENLAHLYLSELLYISYLITLLKTPRNNLRKRKTIFPNTPSGVCNKFACDLLQNINNTRPSRTGSFMAQAAN